MRSFVWLFGSFLENWQILFVPLLVLTPEHEIAFTVVDILDCTFLVLHTVESTSVLFYEFQVPLVGVLFDVSADCLPLDGLFLELLPIFVGGAFHLQHPLRHLVA